MAHASHRGRSGDRAVCVPIVFKKTFGTQLSCERETIGTRRTDAVTVVGHLPTKLVACGERTNNREPSGSGRLPFLTCVK